MVAGTRDSAVKMARDVKAYLARMKGQSSDLEIAQQWSEIEEQYTKR